jgi:hypothetical protein
VILALAGLVTLAVAQDKPPERHAKDQAEADLINSITKAPNPAEKLKLLDKWTADYPQSEYAPERAQEYLATYQALNRPADVFKAAQAILAKDPNDFQALRGALAGIYSINNGNPPPADLAAAEQIAAHMVTDLDAIFAPNKVPMGMTADQWAQVKPAMKVFAQRTIGWTYLVRKDNVKAEAELTKALQMDPTQAATSQMLASAILAQNKTNPEKQPLAIYQYARAAAYSGTGSLDANTRKQLQAFVTKAYNQYHGSNEGLDQLLEMAKNNAMPPADFKIASTADIEAAKIKAQQEADAKDPVMAIWRTIKTGLTGDNPDAFFEMTVKDVQLPPMGKFKGKLVSMTPANRPKELVLAVEKDMPDVTLKLDEGTLPGTMEAGGELEFVGTAKTYRKDPYMLTFEVTKEQITGWTGKNVPVKKAVPKKKAQ